MPKASRSPRGGKPRQQRDAAPRKGQRHDAGKPHRQQRAAGRSRQQRDDERPRDRRPSGAGADLIEGRRAVFEALETGLPLSKAFVAATSQARDPKLEELVSRLVVAGVEVEEVPRARLDEMSSHGAHQGVVVKARPFAYADLADVIAAAGDGDALVVLLDHVTDDGNFGAIVRSAEVVGAAGVVIPKARSARVGTAAYKTSAGAVLHLPIAQVPNLASAIAELKDAGFWVAGSTEHATDVVWDAPLQGRLALVMGSEGSGISRLVLEKCDFTCKLPQRGSVESLNVAQAATVMCYEWMRRTHASGEGL